MKKVCVLNFSGNVGKTTVAANMLMPRMGATLFSVESLNQDASGDNVELKRLRAERFGQLQKQVLEHDNVIVDVGASNAEMFLEMMREYTESHRDYDYFVVPTVKARKQSADTVNTILALRKLGVEPERIRVLFNKVTLRDDLAEEFGQLFGLASDGEFILNKNAKLIDNEVFELIKDSKMSLAEVIADPTDHRELLRHETTPEGKSTRIDNLALKRLSTSCAANMDAAYAALFAN
jgi:MinD-like ATPase involved in chromosome partitioning or flagellar assembly